MATKKTVEYVEKAAEGIYEIPLEKIVAEGQPRTKIDTEGEGFKRFANSVGDRGILQPVIVKRREDGNYLMIAGERRLEACRALGWPTIPARIIDGAETKADILCIQLTENLEREELDPIDTANAMFCYFSARHEGVDLDDLTNILVLYGMEKERVNGDHVSTLDTLVKASGKSATSVKRMLSLLKLPEVIQTEVRNGIVPLSQGYVFAANLDNPGLMEIFNQFIQKPMTVVELESALASFAKKKPPAAPTTPVSRFLSSLKNTKISLTKGIANYNQVDLEKLRDDVKVFTDFLEAQIQVLVQKAAAAAAAKAKKRGPV